MNSYEYLDVLWRHDLPAEPVRLLSELDANRNEVRKVEVFRDGRMDWADANHEIDSTGLSEEPIPDTDAINEDRQFSARSITRSEFEAFWDKATGRS